jgi:CIC family chloride channel protein
MKSRTRSSRRARVSLRRLRSAIPRSDLRLGGRWLFYCAAVGVAAGLGAVAFDVLSSSVLHFAVEVFAGWELSRPSGEKPLFAAVAGHPSETLLVLLPAIGGLVSGALVAWLAPEAAGHGTDGVIDAYHRRGGKIRLRVPLVKVVASAITLGSGGSGGREGPIAQTGAGLGAFVADRLRLSADDRRVLLAAGMGAGIGSIFRAPLAGALFAAEVLYSSAEFEASVLIPACVASIASYSLFTLIRGTGTLFSTPDLAFGAPVELAAYFLLALALVVYGFLYVRLFYGVHGIFERLRLPAAIKPAIGGLLTGGLAIALLHASRNRESLSVLAFGYGTLQHVLDSPAAIAPALLAVIALVKILTTSTTIGSGGSAGVFGPSMVIGGCVGGAVGLVLHRLSPALAPQPAAFLVVGMAGFFAGVAKTPISSLIMVSEITGSYSLLIPSTWVCVLTTTLSRRWNLYSKQVRTRVDSPAHQGSFVVEILRGIPVRSLLDSGDRVAVLRIDDGLDRIRALALSTGQASLPVLGEGGDLVGVIPIDGLRRLASESPPRSLVAKDLMRTGLPRLSPDSDAGEALRELANGDLEELPVWDADAREVVGLLSRSRVMRLYFERLRVRG